jgi:hypothetical protein
MDFGEPVAPDALTVTVAVYVPAASPLVFAVTDNDAGALPLAGDTDNHDASSDALKLNDPVPVLVTDNDCAAGLAPPAVPANDNDPGDTDNTGCGGGGGEPPPTR